MNLRSRVDRLYDRLRPARLVIVLPGPGASVVVLPDGRGLVLHVPGEGESDPAAGLTAAQLALIGPHDQLVLVRYEDRLINDSREGATDDGDDDDD